MINKEDIIWLAGLLEGEGTFYMSHYLRKPKYPTLQYGSSDLDVVFRAARIMKSQNKVTEHRSKFRDGYIRKRHYRISLAGRLAIGWMMTLYSLMGKRRKEKIREVITMWKTTPARYARKS